MDLRGIADVGGDVRYILSGIVAGRKVSKKLIRIDMRALSVSAVEELKLRAYPNTSIDKFRLEGLEFEPQQIQMFDRLGREQSLQWSIIDEEIRFESRSSSGTYFLFFKNEFQARSIRLLIH